MEDYIQKIVEGDEIAFEIVFKLSHKKIYAYFIKKTASSELADELTQLAFIKLWCSRHTLDLSFNLDIQLFRIAKTTLIDHFRKVANEQRKLTSFYLDSISASHTPPSKYETNQQLEAILNQLPPTRRKVFVLSRIDGYTYNEIAKLLSISPKTVERHVSLALKQLGGYAGAAIIVSLTYQLT